MVADRDRPEDHDKRTSNARLPSREDEIVRTMGEAFKADMDHELRLAELGNRIAETSAALDRARKAGDEAEVERLRRLQGTLWRERATLAPR